MYASSFRDAEEQGQLLISLPYCIFGQHLYFARHRTTLLNCSLLV